MRQWRTESQCGCGFVAEDRAENQGKDDATQFVRKYRVGVKVVVQILHAYAYNRAIGPGRGRVQEYDASTPSVGGFGGAAEMRKWASCGCERAVCIDQRGAGPREIPNQLQVLQDVVGWQV